MCAVLVAGFFALNSAIRARIKQGLKDNLTFTEKQFEREEADYNGRDAEVVATLSQNASLRQPLGSLASRPSQRCKPRPAKLLRTSCGIYPKGSILICMP